MQVKKMTESPRERHYRELLERYSGLGDRVPRDEHQCILEALWARRRYAGALKFCRDVCIPALEKADEPDTLAQFWCYLGAMARKLKRFDEAEKAYRKAMRLASWDWEPRFYLGKMALARHDKAAATKFLRQAFKRDYHLLPYAAVEAREALARNDMKHFRDRYLKARGAMEHLDHVIQARLCGSPDPDEVRFSLRRAMRECKDDPNILAFAGYVFLELGQAQRAEKYLIEALTIVPHHPWAHCGMAKLVAERKEWPAVYSHATASVIAADWNKLIKAHDDFREVWKYGQCSPGHFALDLVRLLFDLSNHGWEIEGVEELAKVRRAKAYDLFRMVRDMLLKKGLKPL